jgi:hypothetical protein
MLDSGRKYQHNAMTTLVVLLSQHNYQISSHYQVIIMVQAIVSKYGMYQPERGITI